MGGSKGGGGDSGSTEALMLAQMQAQQAAETGRRRAKEAVQKGREKYVDPLEVLRQPATSGLMRALDYSTNFDERIQPEVQRAQQAYLQPAQQQINQQIGNLASQLGSGGLANSLGQRLLGRAGEEIGAREAQRRYQLEQQVRGQRLGETQQRAQLGMSPLQMLTNAGLGTVGQEVGIETGAGQQQAGIATQMGQAIGSSKQQDAQMRAQQGSPWATLGGAGLSMLTGGK